jgi:energy-coupling factor transporter ATP-binding protein EcfA2
MYTDPEKLPPSGRRTIGPVGLEGLAANAVRAARQLGSAREPASALLRPRKRVTVLLVGNHSSGKSSLCNFLAGAHVQEESAPVETRGFTLVSSALSEGGTSEEVVRVKRHLAVERAPHIAAALGATPEQVAAASLGHGAGGGMPGDTSVVAERALARALADTGGDAETNAEAGALLVAEALSEAFVSAEAKYDPGYEGAARTVAKLASWSAMDDRAFRDLFEVAFVHHPVGSAKSSPLTWFGHLLPHGTACASGPPIEGVDIIDTPGLADGDVTYPFDPCAAIVRAALCADLIIVAMDPVGQSLCSRTLQVVAALNKAGHGERVMYCLTRADLVRSDAELAKLLAQMAPNIASRIADTHGWHLHPLWLPSPDRPGKMDIPGWKFQRSDLPRVDSDADIALPVMTAERGRLTPSRSIPGSPDSSELLAAVVAKKQVSASQNQLGRVLDRIRGALATRAQDAIRRLEFDSIRVAGELSSLHGKHTARKTQDDKRELLLKSSFWAWLGLVILAGCCIFASLASSSMLPDALLFEPSATLRPWNGYPMCGAVGDAPKGGMVPKSWAAVVAGGACSVGRVLGVLASTLQRLASNVSVDEDAPGSMLAAMALLILAMGVAAMRKLVEWRRSVAPALSGAEISKLSIRARQAASMWRESRKMADRLVDAARGVPRSSPTPSTD